LAEILGPHVYPALARYNLQAKATPSRDDCVYGVRNVRTRAFNVPGSVLQIKIRFLVVGDCN